MPKLLLEVDLPDADALDDPEEIAEEVVETGEILSAEWVA